MAVHRHKPSFISVLSHLSRAGEMRVLPTMGCASAICFLLLIGSDIGVGFTIRGEPRCLLRRGIFIPFNFLWHVFAVLQALTGGAGRATECWRGEERGAGPRGSRNKPPADAARAACHRKLSGGGMTAARRNQTGA